MARDDVRKDINRALDKIDDPDEYDREAYEAVRRSQARRRRYGSTPQTSDKDWSEQNALGSSPEGRRRIEDGWTGAKVAAALFLGQRGVRRLLRRGPKPFTGAGLITAPASVASGALVGQSIGVADRKRKKRK